MSQSHPDRVLLCMNARDEYNLEEWVAYHFLIGFDQIIIYDHLSKIPITTTFSKYSLPNLHIYRENNDRTNKAEFMRRSYHYAIQTGATWMIHLDADEYIAFNHVNGKPSYKSIKEFLHDYQSFDAIGINWIVFGSNYLDTNPEPSSLIKNFIRCNSVSHTYTKPIVKPQSIDPALKSYSPHQWPLKPGTKMCNVYKQQLSNYVNTQTKWLSDPISLYHYHLQSYQDYLRRKIRRTRDDARNISYKPVTREQHHSNYNQVTHTLFRDIFLNQITQFLQDHLSANVSSNP
jgi:hypothetical protein